MITSSKEFISVIMNCHNGEKFLNESISSVINQSFSNWELIFFDNQSNDKSIQIAKSFADKRIKFFSSEKYLKLYEARNEAIKLSNGKYITFLDTDDFWEKNKLSMQLNFIEKNNLKICYSNFFIYNQNLRTKKKRIKKNNIFVSTQELLNDYDIGILTTMIDKNVFQNNKFDENFEIIGDFDFFIRNSLDMKIGFLNEVLANYRVHEQNLSFKKIDEYYDEFKGWVDQNKIFLEKYNLSLRVQKIYLFKLWIKKYFLFLKNSI